MAEEQKGMGLGPMPKLPKRTPPDPQPGEVEGTGPVTKPDPPPVFCGQVHLCCSGPGVGVCSRPHYHQTGPGSHFCSVCRNSW